MKIMNKIFSLKKENSHKIITVCGIKMKFRCKNRDIENLTAQINKINAKTNQMFDALIRMAPKPYLTNFTVDITHHCNLNCRGCDHFSPLAEERFYSLDCFNKDMRRLSELTEGYVDRIGIMGGEPLLNPNVIQYLKITRECFPNTKIRLVTNGILLDKQDENFWLTLKNLNIYIEYTKYPINLDYKKLDELMKKYEVPIDVYSYNQKVIKTSYKIPLDFNGNQHVCSNFAKCFQANNCISLKEGKLYTCTVAPSIEHFNKYFNKNIPLSPRDGIDIHEAKNINEILEFLAKPIPFCKYCNVNGRTYGHKWGISKKEMKEWV